MNLMKLCKPLRFFRPSDTKLDKILRARKFYLLFSFSYVSSKLSSKSYNALVYHAIASYYYGLYKRADFMLLKALQLSMSVLGKFPEVYITCFERSFETSGIECKALSFLKEQIIEDNCSIDNKLLLFRVKCWEDGQNIWLDLTSEGICGVTTDTALLYFLSEWLFDHLLGSDDAIRDEALNALFIMRERSTSQRIKYVIDLVVARILVILGSKEKALQVANKMIGEGQFIAEALEVCRIAYSGLGYIESFYKNSHPGRYILAEAFGSKYLSHNKVNNIIKSDSVHVLSVHGPGDVIRQASLLQHKLRFISAEKITLYTDDKLLPLLKRSLGHLKVKPSYRAFRSNYKNLYSRAQIDKIRELPDNRLSQFMDAAFYRDFMSDQGALVTTTLDLVHNYRLVRPEIGCDLTYLQTSEKKDRHWHKWLSNAMPVKSINIGVSWTTSLVTGIRSAHILPLNTWAEILSRLESQFACTFHSLQFGLPESELREHQQILSCGLNKELQDIPYLDGYNDIDSLASFIKQLDVVICHSTYIADLAGGLGVKTLCLSRTETNRLNAHPETGEDLWFPSIKYLFAVTCNDYNSLIERSVIEMNKVVAQ